MESFVPILVALITTLGTGVFFREIADIVSKIRRGVSTRETNRKNDIIGQRDSALKRADEQEERADAERKKRIAWQEYAGSLRWRLREHGINPDPYPDGIEDTIIPT